MKKLILVSLFIFNKNIFSVDTLKPEKITSGILTLGRKKIQRLEYNSKQFAEQWKIITNDKLKKIEEENLFYSTNNPDKGYKGYFYRGVLLQNNDIKNMLLDKNGYMTTESFDIGHEYIKSMGLNVKEEEIEYILKFSFYAFISEFNNVEKLKIIEEKIKKEKIDSIKFYINSENSMEVIFNGRDFAKEILKEEEISGDSYTGESMTQRINLKLLQYYLDSKRNK